MFRPFSFFFTRLAVAIFLCLSGPGQAAAADAAPPAGPVQPVKPRSTLLVYFENDLFYDEDRYYTNAVQIRYISPDLRTLAENDLLPKGISGLLGDLPFPGSKNAVQYNISLGMGQQIYTPERTNLSNPPPGDRPYAGYLYGFLALHAKQENRLDTLELAGGIIGPSALGEQAQNEVHRFRGMETARGWDHQLRDEPALMLSWTRTWRLNDNAKGWGWDILPHVSVSAGTPYTQAAAGGEFRLGWNLPPDFGTSTIRPGSGIYAPGSADSGQNSGSFRDNLSIYAFAGAEGRGVAHNTFLDGNLWKDSRSVDKFPFVGELNYGLAVSFYDFRLSYTHVIRSKEFHGQDKNQNFGAITLGYTF